MTESTRVCLSCHTPLPDEARFCLNCGTPTPTEPGVPPRTAATGTVEVDKVRRALAKLYAIERVLGEGGMATVYLAKDLKHRRQVAVKVMRPELAATLGADRFLREIEIAAQLNHPNILPVHDSGEADGILYYVMPYIEGETVRERVRRDGPLPVDDALQIAREMAEALGYAHRRGIIHRDIKPANVMLSEGHALVADFGIARATGGNQALTQTGLAVGTPQYMSPEQATGQRDIDARSDVYAIGAVLYEMLVGEAPYTGPTPQAVLARALTEEPEPLATRRPDVPAPVTAVVAKAMARHAAERYITGTDLEKAIADVRDASRASRVVAASPGPSALKVWGVFGVGAVVSLVVILGLITRWGLPTWTLALAGGLLVIGAAVLLGTGRVEARRRAGTTISGPGRWLTWRNATLGGAGAAALWIVVALVMVFRGPSAAAATAGVHVAVLPFDNLGSADDAYFADGVADAVRGKLTDVSGLRVTARTSSAEYRGTTKPLTEIGHELSVDYLVTGTVQWAHGTGGAGQVQVVSELIDAKTGDAKWQQSFAANVTDVFSVQAAIASRVASALGIALGTADEEQIAKRPTDNFAAYELYLKAKALTNVDPATLRTTADYYQQAVTLDPQFGEAWARLSLVLSTLYNNGRPDSGIAARAKAAAERAVALDKQGVLGHWAMAVYYGTVPRNQDSVNAETELAWKAAPNDPDMLRRVAGNEFTDGHVDSAIAHLEQARSLDPRSLPTVQTLSAFLLRSRQYAKALEAGNAALALDPTNMSTVENVAMTHLAQGDLAGARAVIAAVPSSVPRDNVLVYLAVYWDLWWMLTDQQQQRVLALPTSAFYGEPSLRSLTLMQVAWLRGDRTRARAFADSGVASLRQTLRATPNDPQSHVLLGLCLAYLGQKDEAISEGLRGTALEPAEHDLNAGTYYAHQLARIYMLVGEQDKAIDVIEKLLSMPYYLSPGWLRIDPTFDPIRNNPRFQSLVAGG